MKAQRAAGFIYTYRCMYVLVMLTLNSEIDHSSSNHHRFGKAACFEAQMSFSSNAGCPAAPFMIHTHTHTPRSLKGRDLKKFTICQRSYWCSQLSSAALEAVFQNLEFLLLYPAVCMLCKTNKNLTDSYNYDSKQLTATHH